MPIRAKVLLHFLLTAIAIKGDNRDCKSILIFLINKEMWEKHAGQN